MSGSWSRDSSLHFGCAERRCSNRERGKGEGKIKAQSRDASYVIVCTSIFIEVSASSLAIREIIGQQLRLFQAFALSRFFLMGSSAPELERSI